MRSALLLVALLLVGSVGAWSGSARADTLNLDYAKIHFEAGKAYYDEAKYQDALKEFAEAYRLSQKPALLYNIARCDERLGRTADAVEALKKYLQLEPGAEDRASIERHIEDLERSLDTANRPGTRGPPPPKRLATWIVGGAGFALLGGALATYFVSRDKLLDLESVCGNGAVCPADKQSERDTGQALAYTSYGLFAAGGLALASSVVLYFLEDRLWPADAQKPRTTLAPTVIPGGAGLAATLSF